MPTSNDIEKTPTETPRELIDYSDIETTSRSNTELEQRSLKTKVVTLLPINTSKRNKQTLKRKNNIKPTSEQKQQKSRIKDNDFESAGSLSQDNE